MSLPNGPPLRRPFLPALLPAVLVASLIALAGCSVGEFIGSYFNTYYNASRAFSEAEAELLGGQDPKQAGGYLAPYTVPAGAKTKFTSVIEKCSKILQYHAESQFVDDALMMIGKSYYYQNENPSAERKFRELIEGQPSSDLVPEAKLLLVNTLYRSGDREGAKVGARAILQAEEGLFNPDIRSRAALLLATIEMDAKNFEAARGEYAGAAENADAQLDRFNALMRVAEMYQQLNNPQKAGETYARAEEEATDYLTEYRARIGRARMLSAVGSNDEALTELQDLSGNTNNKDFFGEIDLEIGNTYRAMGDMQEAVAQYRYVDTSYARTEFSSKASYELGLLYEKQLLQYDSARVAYARGRGTAGQTPVGTLLGIRSDAMNRYAVLRAELTKNDSLRQAILIQPDSLLADSLSSGGESPADSLARAVQSPADSLARAVQSPADSLARAAQSPADSFARAAQSPADSLARAAQSPADTASALGRPDGLTAGTAGTADTALTMTAADSILRAGSADSLTHQQLTQADSAATSRPRTVPVAVPLDTVEARLALAKSELGALFFNTLEVNDSASYWFNMLLVDHPSSPYIPRALYTMAQIARQDSNLSAADSLYRVLVERYPQSEFGATARRFLGIAEPVDSTAGAAMLYGSAEQLLSEGNQQQALEKLSTIVSEHPSSPLAAKAEYAIGWIYQEVVDNPDSALVHYRSLIERFPTSQYSVKVKPVIDAVDQELRAREAAKTVPKDTVDAKEAPAPPPATTETPDSMAGGAPPDSVAQPPIENEPGVEDLKENPDEEIKQVDEPPPGPEEKEEPPPPPQMETATQPEYYVR